MKKILLIFLLGALLLLTSCNSEMISEEEYNEDGALSVSMFVKVEDGSDYIIVYHRDTKVMYAISDGYYNSGTFTVLLMPDGTPMLWSK